MQLLVPLHRGQPVPRVRRGEDPEPDVRLQRRGHAHRERHADAVPGLGAEEGGDVLLRHPQAALRWGLYTFEFS